MGFREVPRTDTRYVKVSDDLRPDLELVNVAGSEQFESSSAHHGL